MRLSRRELGLWALGTSLPGGCRKPTMPGHDSGEMARHQWFFAAQHPQPVLLALVLQRTRAPGDTTTRLEAKAFVVAGGKLQSIFFRTATLPGWPGATLQGTVQAWQRVGLGPGLRLETAGGQDGVGLSIQQPSSRISLDCPRLTPPVRLVDPHGPADLASGPAALVVNGARWQGTLVQETLLPGARDWVRYGRFEMWALLTAEGTLGLGRLDYQGHSGRGELLLAEPTTRRVIWQTDVVQEEVEATTGWPLARSWRAQWGPSAVIRRVDGTLQRGRSPGGGPAIYDIGVGAGDGTLALIFALRDGA